jgi:hypothetical protein
MARWDEDEILEHIRRRAANGLVLGAKDMRREDRALLDAARRHFGGGWQDALEAAADKWPQLPRLRQAADAHHVGPLPAIGDGAKLRAARMAAGLSQRQLGEITGDGQAQASNWERGRVGIPLRAWQACGLSGAPDGDPPELRPVPAHRPKAAAPPPPARKVQVVLSDAAWQQWLAWPSGDRSANVSRLIEIEAQWVKTPALSAPNSPC